MSLTGSPIDAMVYQGKTVLFHGAAELKCKIGPL